MRDQPPKNNREMPSLILRTVQGRQPEADKKAKKGGSLQEEVWAPLSKFVDLIRTGIPKEKRAEVHRAAGIFLKAMRNAGTAVQ